MKKVFTGLTTILLLMISPTSFGQDVYLTKSGTISFYSSAPLEDIRAENRKAVAALNTSSGEIAVVVTIQNFEFDKKLMKKHFNEQYMESEIFPEAYFSGYLLDFNIDELESTKKAWEASGKLKIHGIEKPLNTTVYLNVKDEEIVCETSFVISLKSFDIKVPRVVIKNIAEEIEVTSKFILGNESE